GLPGGANNDDQLYGLYLYGADDKIIGNKIYDSYTGISVSGARGVVSGNEVYGNRSGIEASESGSSAADYIVVMGNTVHDNTQYGINATGAVISNNTVYGQSAANARGIYGGQDVFNNVVYGNYDGIATSVLVRNNRVFNN